MKKTFIILFTIGGLISCSSPKQENETTEKIPIINLSDNVQEVKSLPLSDVAAKVEIVPMEVTDNSLLYSFWKMDVSEHYIWICCIKDWTIRRFSRDGRFLNRIGKKGQGPGEYTYLTHFFVDEDKKEVCIVTDFNGVFIYDFNGNFKRKVTSAEGLYPYRKRVRMPGYYWFQNRLFVTASLPFPHNKIVPKDSIWSIAIADSNFIMKKIFKNPVYNGREEYILESQEKRMKGNIDYLLEIPPRLDFYGDQMTVKFDDTDTIYRYETASDTLVPQYAIYANEERGDFKDTHQRYMELKWFDYFRLINYMNTKDFIYLTACKEKMALHYCYDKRNGQVRLSKKEGEINERKINSTHTFYSFKGNYDFTNDICGGNFTVDYQQAGKYWIMLYWPDEEGETWSLDTIKAAQVKDEALKEKFVKALEDMMADEDSNPILMIVTLK